MAGRFAVLSIGTKRQQSYLHIMNSSGYRYAMDDYVCYINHEEGTWERRAVGTSSGQRPELSPLMSGTYQVFIPAVDLIETDQKSSLLLIVKLPTSNGSQEFVYRLR